MTRTEKERSGIARQSSTTMSASSSRKLTGEIFVGRREIEEQAGTSGGVVVCRIEWLVDVDVLSVDYRSGANLAAGGMFTSATKQSTVPRKRFAGAFARLALSRAYRMNSPTIGSSSCGAGNGASEAGCRCFKSAAALCWDAKSERNYYKAYRRSNCSSLRILM